LKDSIKAKLDNVSERHEEIAALLGDADTISDQNRFRDLSREYSQLEPVVKAYADYKTTTDDLESAREMADDPDPDMRDMAQDEIATAEAKLESLNLDLQKLLLPRDPRDENNVFIEITATVAVLPEVQQVEEVDINAADLRIDTYRASGAGGQHVNKTDSAIRITHIPTGIVVECQDERSQHKNRARAMSLLQARLLNDEVEKQLAEQTESRRLQVGSGDRSERIRTYNYPQGRVTDHRINLTLYKLEEIANGALEQVIDPLLAEHQADLLAEMGD